MSEWSTVLVKIKDLEALAAACEELGVRLLSGNGLTARGWSGHVRHAPHVIRLRGPYDIAVEPSSEQGGTYEMSTDWWDGHVASEVGENYGRLLQTYGVIKTERMARVHGLRVNKKQMADGSIQLTLQGNNL